MTCQQSRRTTQQWQTRLRPLPAVWTEKLPAPTSAQHLAR